MKKKVVTDIPDEDVQQQIDDFKDDGCKTVTKSKLPNGLWTVEALCPEKRE